MDKPQWYQIAEAELGVHETPGPAATARIAEYHAATTLRATSDEVPWCLNGEVEVLTDSGFIQLKSLPTSALVAQVDPKTLAVSLVQPLAYIVKPYEGKLVHIKSRDLDFICDPQHRFLGLWNWAKLRKGKTDPYALRPITDLTSVLSIPPVAYSNETDNRNWSDRDLTLLAAFLSDGCIHHKRIAIQVSKPRKLLALSALNPALTYTASKAYGRSKAALTTFEFRVPPAFADVFSLQDMPKKAPAWSFLWALSRRQLVHFVKEYAIFDGSSKGGSLVLYSSRPQLRDWLQAAITLAGYHSAFRQGTASPFSGKPCFQIVFNPKKQSRTLRPTSVIKSEGKIDLYCIEVPSGAFVMRDPSGTVIPIGNCSSFVNWCMLWAGIEPTHSAAAHSWANWGEPSTPRLGAIVVIQHRQAGSDRATGSGSGYHVGFWAGADAGHARLLGGNQADQVKISNFPLRDYAIVACRWPATIPVAPAPIT